MQIREWLQNAGEEDEESIKQATKSDVERARSDYLEEKRRLYLEATRAGERLLGAQMFEEHAGSFWQLLDTRPYMRAKAALAGVLANMGESREAISHYK